MSEHTDFHADPNHEDLFEREMRGYSRRRVDEFVAKTRSQVRDLEDRVSQALDANERLRLELSSAREASAEKPAHEEISERIGQILKLAEDESKAQRGRADEEIAKLREMAQQETAKLRDDVKAETDKTRAEAHEQAERMLSAAQEQAESTVANATSEADKTRNSARSEAERAVTEATKQAESAVSTAKAQAKQQLDEATARATAIHDGAERRLNLLMSRHTEAIRRLTEIRDVVTTLVAGEAARGSLEEEVARAVAAAQAETNGGQPPAANGGRPGQQAEGRRGPATAAQAQAASPAQGAQGARSAAGSPAQRPAPAGSQSPSSAQADPDPLGVAPSAGALGGPGQQAGKPAATPAGRTAAPTVAPASRTGVGPHEGARHAASPAQPTDSDDRTDSLRGARDLRGPGRPPRD
jgi:cell division septum initiation protein DivIVA